MQFEFTVSAEVERSEGKFASRDELAEQILEAIDNANPGDLTGDAGGSYSVDTWDVNEVTVAKKAKSAKADSTTDYAETARMLSRTLFHAHECIEEADADGMIEDIELARRQVDGLLLALIKAGLAK
jgi:hypothetical protein